jgi:hypothetical protein
MPATTAFYLWFFILQAKRQMHSKGAAQVDALKGHGFSRAVTAPNEPWDERLPPLALFKIS